MRNLDKILLVKHLMRQCNSSETKEVEAWLNESEENRIYFQELETTWQLGNSVEKYYTSVDVNDELQKFHEAIALPEKEGKRIPFFGFLKVASVVLLVANIGLVVSLMNTKRQNLTSSLTEMIVPNGSKSRVTLPDGSTVWLNSGSKLTYESNFNQKIREVVLEGEGYFDVAKDKSRPFIVRTSKLSVRALGTEFNVRCYPDEGTIETTLIEGSVKVMKKDKSASGSDDVMLMPNQKLTFIKTTGKLFTTNAAKASDNEISGEQQNADKQIEAERKEQIIVKTIDPLPVIAWKEDKLILTGERFEEVKVKLERWYDVTINIKDPEILDLRFKGSFKKESVVQALEALQLASPFHFQLDKKTITITK